jgi:hypothetical protein
LLLASPVLGQAFSPSISTVSNLPAACRPGVLYIVTDSNSATSCATGGSSNYVACACNAAGNGYNALNSDSGGTPTQIVAGDSDMTVADAGAGTITATVDTSAIGIWDVGGLTIGGADVTDTLVLPISADAVTPTLAFGDGDTGFYEGTEDDIYVSLNGGVAFRFQGNGTSSQIRSTLSGGPALRNATSTATVPGFLPNSADTDTGIGQSANGKVTVIGDGIQIADFNTIASGVNYFDITPSATGNRPTIDVEGTDANIALGLVAKDSSVDLDPDGDGAFEWDINQSRIQGDVGSGPNIRNEPSSATNPTLVPDSGSPGSGLGGVTGNASLIANSIEGLTVDENAYGTAAGDIVWFIPDLVTAPSTNPTGGVIIYSDADDLYIRDTTGTATNLTTGAATNINDLGDAGAAGSVDLAEWAQDWTWASGSGTAAALDAFTLDWTYPSTVTTDSGTQRLLRLTFPDNAGDAVGQIEAMLSVDNADANDAPAYGIRVDATQAWGSSALLVPSNADAATPSIAFGDGDTGLYESSDDTLAFAVNGTRRFFMNSASDAFDSNNAQGPKLKNTTSSNTVPTLIPRSSDTTGIGGGATDVSVIVSGIEAARFNTAASGVNYLDFTPAATGNDPVLRGAGEANTDLALDTSGAGQLRLMTGGTQRFSLNTSVLQGIQSGAARVVNVDATATDPVFSFQDDINTGIGAGAADEVTLIAGAIEAMTIAEGAYGTAANDITWFIPDLVTAPSTNPTGGIIIYSDAESLWIRDTTGTATDLTAGGAPGVDSIGTSELDDSADTPLSGEWVQVSGDTTDFVYRTDAELLTDTGAAALAGPVFTGDPTAPTPSVDDNDTSIATTAFVQAETVAAGDVTGTIASGLTIGAGVVEEAMMSTEDFGDFSCGAGADDCLLDAGAVSGGAAGDITDDTIVGNDIAAAYAGGHLTETTNVLNVDTEAITHTFSFVLEDPVVGDSGELQHSLNIAGTITRIQCSTDTGTVDINIEERALATPNTAGVDAMAADLQCDNNSAVQTSLQNQPIDATDPIALTISATASTPGWLRVHVTYTVDDV